MNDFTKEELQIILLDMNVYINRTTILAESPSHKSLRNKVESMIDNYCEHENDYVFNAVPMDGSPKMCKKCKGFWI